MKFKTFNESKGIGKTMSCENPRSRNWKEFEEFSKNLNELEVSYYIIIFFWRNLKNLKEINLNK